MKECYRCKSVITFLPFKCNYCSEYFCDNHRLPEEHNCNPLKEINDSKRDKWNHIVDIHKESIKRKTISLEEDEIDEINEIYEIITIPTLFKMVLWLGGCAFLFFLLMNTAFFMNLMEEIKHVFSTNTYLIIPLIFLIIIIIGVTFHVWILPSM